MFHRLLLLLQPSTSFSSSSSFCCCCFVICLKVYNSWTVLLQSWKCNKKKCLNELAWLVPHLLLNWFAAAWAWVAIWKIAWSHQQTTQHWLSAKEFNSIEEPPFLHEHFVFPRRLFKWHCFRLVCYCRLDISVFVHLSMVQPLLFFVSLFRSNRPFYIV